MSATTKAVRIGLALAVFAGFGARVRADDDGRIKLDCGVNALYVLLHLEGRPVSIDRIVSALPAPHPEGHSMAELAAAARSLGLPLEGVRFAKGDSRPDKSMIAFLKDARGGHFAVLRPVGLAFLAGAAIVTAALRRRGRSPHRPSREAEAPGSLGGLA